MQEQAQQTLLPGLKLFYECSRLQENIFSHFPAEKQLLMRYRTLKQGSHALLMAYYYLE